MRGAAVRAGVAVIALAGLSGARVNAQDHQHGAAVTRPSIVQIPSSVAAEHREIHERLERAAKLPGSVGEAARAVVTLLAPHFVREEQIALPPLGLLRAASENKFEPALLAILPLADSLTRELPRMLAEHERIATATMHLAEVARASGNAEVGHLAQQLRLHALSEEEVLYPAAVLVGNWLRTQSQQCKCHKH